MPSLIYSAFNPIALAASTTLSQSNQIATVPTGTTIARSTLALSGKSSGQWFFEMTSWYSGSANKQRSYCNIGLATSAHSRSTAIGLTATSIAAVFAVNGSTDVLQIWYNNASIAGNYTLPADAVDKVTIGVGLHFILGVPYVTFYCNGHRVYSGSLPFAPYFPAMSIGSAAGVANNIFFNAGQRAWLYAPREIPGWFDFPDAIPELRFADGNFLTAPDDAIPNQTFPGRMPEKQSITIARRIRFAPLGGSLKSSASASIIVDNRDGGLDSIIAADHKGLPITIARPVASRMSGGTPVASLSVDSIDPIDNSQARISVRDGSFDLDVPLQRMLIPPCYESAVANQPWPFAFGSPGQVSPPLLDSFSRLFAGPDDYFNERRITDKGAALTNVSGYTKFPDRRKFTTAVQAQGIVTLELQTLGDTASPLTDQFGGKGAPFAGTAGALPTGWTSASAPAGNAPKLSGTACILGTSLTDNESAYSGLSCTGVTLASGDAAILEITVDDNNLAGTGRAWTLSLAGAASPGLVAQGALWVCTRPGVYKVTVVNRSASAAITPTFVLTSGAPGQSVKISAVKLRILPGTGITAGYEGNHMLLGAAIAAVMRMAGRDPSKYSRADADAIDAATGYAGVDFYADSSISGRDALIQLLDSYTATLFDDAAGITRFVRLIAPETGTVTGAISDHDMIGDLTQTGGDAPNLSTQWGWRRNPKVMSETDWVTDFSGVPMSFRLPRQKPYQSTISTAVQVARRYIKAVFAKLTDNCLGLAADVQTEADRVAGIMKIPRFDYKCSTAKTGFELGQIWIVKYPRYGLDAGKALMVLGIVENLDDDTRTIEFWG